MQTLRINYRFKPQNRVKTSNNQRFRDYFKTFALPCKSCIKSVFWRVFVQKKRYCMKTTSLFALVCVTNKLLIYIAIAESKEVKN